MINETPEGKLADYLIGDLGPARRHVQRLLNGTARPTLKVYEEIEASIDRCIERIKRDIPGASE